MKEHALQNNVRDISMSAIGSGLDRLRWTSVQERIRKVFEDSGIHISVYWQRNQDKGAVQAYVINMIRLREQENPLEDTCIKRIDTRDARRIYAQEHTPGAGVEMDPENRDRSIGKMYHYKLHSSLPEWSPNIRWINTDFVTATNLLVGTATADFSVRN